MRLRARDPSRLRTRLEDEVQKEGGCGDSDGGGVEVGRAVVVEVAGEQEVDRVGDEAEDDGQGDVAAREAEGRADDAGGLVGRGHPNDSQ